MRNNKVRPRPAYPENMPNSRVLANKGGLRSDAEDGPNSSLQAISAVVFQRICFPGGAETGNVFEKNLVVDLAAQALTLHPIPVPCSIYVLVLCRPIKTIP